MTRKSLFLISSSLLMSGIFGTWYVHSYYENYRAQQTQAVQLLPQIHENQIKLASAIHLRAEFQMSLIQKLDPQAPILGELKELLAQPMRTDADWYRADYLMSTIANYFGEGLAAQKFDPATARQIEKVDMQFQSSRESYTQPVIQYQKLVRHPLAKWTKERSPKVFLFKAEQTANDF